MKKCIILFSLAVLSSILLLHGCSSSEQPAKPKEQMTGKAEQSMPEGTEAVEQAAQSGSMGEKLFNEHCKKCHRNGGNIINPEKTLYKDALEANNIRTPEDIIRIMRSPGKGMPKYDENKIPDEEARQLGEYILGTFK